MSREVWKSFEDNTLTHSAAHYLMTIRELLDTQGYARVTDIAKRHGVTRAAVSKRCVELTRALNLKPSRAMRSESSQIRML